MRKLNVAICAKRSSSEDTRKKTQSEEDETDKHVVDERPVRAEVDEFGHNSGRRLSLKEKIISVDCTRHMRNSLMHQIQEKTHSTNLEMQFAERANDVLVKKEGSFRELN